MKIVKGVAIYTLLIFGALVIFAMLLVGCMFMFPNFDVFGWKVMFKSNDSAVAYGASSESFKVTKGAEYTINIDAGVHNVYIHQFSKAENDTDYVYVEKIDDMFGLYSNEYNNQLIKPEDSEAAKNRIINIKLGEIEGLVSGRKSRLDVYLPNIASGYNLKITTTTGNISINGSANKVENLNVTGLEVATSSGDFAWSNVKTSIINNAGDDNIYTGSKVDSIDTEDEDYKKENFDRYVFLKNFRASTVSGKLDFSLSHSDAGKTIIAPATAGEDNMYDVLAGKYTTDVAIKNWLNELASNSEAGFYVDIERGDIKFSNVLAQKFNVVGTDVLIEANSISSLCDFYFNVPNGVFKIENLNSPLSTIITNNIDIDLESADGELAITTTYGNITIDTINENASLSSTHGNINVTKAYASISAISQYGDITVGAYRDKGYLKNKYGKINASFDVKWYINNIENATSTDTDYYNKTFEMYNEDGSITANNLVFETKIVNNGGNVSATFYKMANNKNASNYVSHSISLNGGNASVQVSSLEAFKFKGKGNISGQIGGTNITATEEFVRILVPNQGSPEASLACLEANATNASISFSSYFYEAPEAA